MKYYIIDTTLNSKDPIYYSTLNELVHHLEGSVVRKFGQTRKQFMQHLIDLGHGYDDPEGKTFTQVISDYFNIGVVKDNRHVKCNVHEVSIYGKYINEMGQ